MTLWALWGMLVCRERTEAANLVVSVSAVNHTTYDDTSYV